MKITNIIKGIVASAVITTVLVINSTMAFAAGTCKVSADAAKIRESASTSAEVVGSTVKGHKLDVLGSTKDSEGYTWYKVNNDGNSTGYIRADLVTDVEGDFPSDNGDSNTKKEENTSTETESEPVEVVTTTVNPSAYSFGTTTDTVSVREAASTKSAKKATTAAGQDVAITGEAVDDAGMTWYQINYGDINGFIRSDFLTVGDSDESEEVPEETEEPEEAVDVTAAPVMQNADYELRYEANDQGVDTWYLYDHIKGTRQSLDNIFAVMQQSQEMSNSNNADSSKLKIILIIMGVVILGLIVAVTLLAFKLRDSYEWEDEDDDEADEPEDDESYEEEEEDNSDVPEEEPEEDDIKIVTKKSKPKKASSLTKPSKALQEDRKEAWQSKNFLDIDDDMEFEFLDIDK